MNYIEANSDTSGWDTSSVTNMLAMFAHAHEAKPDTSGWDTSNVTNMAQMFESVFELSKANPDTSRWNTSKVTHMEFMFSLAPKANPDTSSWNFKNVTSFKKVFDSSGLSTENYSKLLINLSKNTPTKTDIWRKIDVGQLKYNSKAEAARFNLVNKGWSIKDGALD